MIFKLFRISLRDLWFSRRKVFWMILFLSLAASSALLSISFQSAVEKYVSSQARGVLSADLSISSLNPLNSTRKAELDSLIKPKKTSEIIEFRSMINSPSGSLLSEIRAVDKSYPLIGTIKLMDSAEELSQGAYVYPEVLSELKLKVGENLRIGKESFKILGIVEQDPGGASRIFSFAPRIYISRDRVEATGLLLPGSQIFYRYFYLTNEPLSEDQIKKWQSQWETEDFFLTTPEDSLDVMKRFFGFFEKTLHLLSLSVILMCLFVAFYLFQVFLRDRLAQNALLKSLGVQSRNLVAVHFAQIFIVGFFSCFAASLWTPTMTMSANRWIQSQGLDDFNWALDIGHFQSLLAGLVIVAAVFMAPSLRDIYRTKIQDLFGDSSDSTREAGDLSGLRILPILVLVFFLSVALTSSWKFSLAIAATLTLLSFLSLLLKRLSLRLILFSRQGGLLRVAANQISKNRLSMNLSFLSLVFVAFIIQIIPHLRNSLESELRSSKLNSLPSLFAFNIPEEEASQFVQFMRDNQAEARYLSPMIPARLIAVNGKAPEEDRFRKFPVRLSYRDGLLSSEKVIAGFNLKDLDPHSNPTPISLEKEFADRSGIKLNDELEFDILGIKIVGKVMNFREVDWLQFHPSFFIQFPPGIIEDAPKTMISSVYFDSSRNSNELLLKAIDQFPNISILDVRRTIDRILSIVKKMALSLQMTSLLSIILCSISFVSLLVLSVQARRREASILKALGISPSRISKLFITEYVLMSLIAGLVGFVFAATAAYAVVKYSFDLSVSLSWTAALVVILSLLGVSALVSSQIWRGLVLRDLR